VAHGRSHLALNPQRLPPSLLGEPAFGHAVSKTLNAKSSPRHIRLLSILEAYWPGGNTPSNSRRAYDWLRSPKPTGQCERRGAASSSDIGKNLLSGKRANAAIPAHPGALRSLKRPGSSGAEQHHPVSESR
jgi:hypothetical protein